MESPAATAVRHMWAALQEGGVDSFLAHVEPSAEVVPIGAGGRTLHGHDEIRAWWAQRVEDGRRIESVLYDAEVHGEHVLAHGGLRTIAGNGLSDTQLYWLCHMPHGRLLRAETFPSRARALAALERDGAAVR